MHSPELLILDEPPDGLDSGGIETIGAVLAEQAKSGCGVLLSSLQLDLVENLCESVTIINQGRLVVAGRVDDLASAGYPRLAVRVEGDRDGTWVRELTEVKVSEVAGGEVRLVLEEENNSPRVLDAAARAGRVTKFDVERRRLSEVFREALRSRSPTSSPSSPPSHWCDRGWADADTRSGPRMARRARAPTTSSPWSASARSANACEAACFASRPS